MAARLIVLFAALTLSLGSSFALAAAAADRGDSEPQVENSKYQFSAVINANSVNIRSGPSENYYATAKVDKGTAVTVVGIKFDWLKILPPEGSYSVIAKALVDREPGSNVGTVNGENTRVRAGSTLTPVKVAVQCKLQKGAKVSILGEEDAYYQIKPPPDAYVYVHQKYVTPVKQIAAAPAAANPNDAPKPKLDSAATPPTTQPANVVVETSQPDEAAENRVAVKAESEFDRLEADLKTSLEKPLDQQPIAGLITGYETLVKNPALSIQMRRVSEIRLIGLRGKLQAQQELIALQKQQQQSLQKIQALQAERKAIEERLAGGVTTYTAVGTLQASTLQFGKGTLYRLTDPGTTRTLCYVRSDEGKLNPFLEKFVGVRGEVGNDPQVSLQIVAAVEIAAIDSAKVNKGITAQISPPSLLGKTVEQATTGGNQ